MQTKPQTVTVRISHPSADEAYLTGEFNRWRVPGMPMRQVQDNAWEAQVPQHTAAGLLACAIMTGGRVMQVLPVKLGCAHDLRKMA